MATKEAMVRREHVVRPIQMELLSNQDPRWIDLPASTREEVKGMLRKLLQEAVIARRSAEGREDRDEREDYA
jgi:hypothetical protein